MRPSFLVGETVMAPPDLEFVENGARLGLGTSYVGV
jgi:hypothetical protein